MWKLNMEHGLGPWTMNHGPRITYGTWSMIMQLEQGPWIMELTAWSIHRGAWSMDHRPWIMDSGPSMDHGSWTVDYPWTMDMGCGPPMDHGPWTTEHVQWSVDHGTWSMEQEQQQRSVEQYIRGVWSIITEQGRGGWNKECSTWNMGPWNAELGPGARNMEHGTWSCFLEILSFVCRQFQI